MTVFAVSVTEAAAASRWMTPKRRTIRVRLLMALPPASPTTAGRNLETFVAEQELPHGAHQLVKLSYEYLYYQPPLTQSSGDKQLTYKVRAFRDRSCDESLAAIGQELGLDQQSVTQAVGLHGSHVMLACYRTTPEDCLSVERGKGE